ncbi:glycosyltransferase [Alicyclobacillus sp.]|uniref:glycosyltransferase n=1 Tax=Alicyclobacillus sp. TaxID=61169 RepID=UPI0025C5E93F|nr:glycosyltransferase [Alicyclobacillus sp.]MCL6516560.1 glycosyltransferase [Alicyclobacillus sp.]
MAAIQQWLTIGMSGFDTPGFHDTSRLMTAHAPGSRAYVEPPPPFGAWRSGSAPLFRWRSRRTHDTWILTPPLPVPSRLDVGRIALRTQARALDRVLREAWGNDWRTSTVLYITNWSYAQEPLVRLLRPVHLVFDLVDDVLAFPYSFDRERVLARWRRLAGQAGAVIAVSDALRAWSAAHLGHPVHVLPNGVDAAHFQQAAPAPGLPPVPPGHVRVGFAGTMNHWIDFRALAKVMDADPACHLFLMGRRGHIDDPDQRSALDALLSHPRVHALGPVPYAALPAHLHAMDVLVLPRIPSPASTASSPLKLYEYLAVGRPVVTSGIPVPADVARLVYSASPGDLTGALRQAIAEAQGDLPSLRAERRAYAQAHTWQDRVARVLELVNHGPDRHAARAPSAPSI